MPAVKSTRILNGAVVVSVEGHFGVLNGALVVGLGCFAIAFVL